MDIRFRWQPKQAQLLSLTESDGPTWIGYGGSRGGAKSHGGRQVILSRRITNPNTRGCIFRRTWEKVRENHIEPLFIAYPFMREWYNVQDKELKLPNGSVLCFRYGERRSDINDFIGKEYMDMLVDQAEMLTESELATLKSCVRWPRESRTKCKMIMTFNPGNVGHAFLKRVLWDKEYREQEDPGDYAFIQAFGWDNVEWCKDALLKDSLTESEFYRWPDQTRFEYFITRSQYGRDLNALPKAFRLGWLLGSMDEFSGQYFDVWNPEKHIRRLKLETWHSRWLGIDWGFGHDAACMWFAQPEHNLTSVYREFIGSGRSPRALAQEIVDRTSEEERKKIGAIWLSHDAFAERTEVDTIAQQMADVFMANAMPAPVIGGKDPKGAAALIYDMLKGKELAIDPSCVRLIGTIPMITRDEKDIEKTVKFEGDDSYDAVCIGLKSRLQESTKPLDVRVMDRLDVMQSVRTDSGLPPQTDPTALAMMSRLAVAKEQRKERLVPLITPRFARMRKWQRH